MKRAICFLLALLMAFSLTACFKSEEEKAQEALDKAIEAADAIFDEASDKRVKFETSVDEVGELGECYIVEAKFNSEKFDSIKEMEEYLEEEIKDGPYKEARKLLKEHDLEIVVTAELQFEDNKLTVALYKNDITSGPLQLLGPEGDGDEEDPHIPGADYSGEDFTFLAIKHSDAMKDYYGGAFIDAEAFTGGRINDAVFTRNLAVENKYKVVIKERVEVNSDPATLLQQYIMSGDFTFDVIYGWANKLGPCIVENYFADFNELEGVDLTQEYWSPSTIDDLAVCGRLYLSQNEISMNVIDWATCLLYNKTLAQNIRIEEEEFGFGSPYEMVDNGTWTYDKFLGMIQAASQDTDGDGAVTRNDIFGLLDGNGLGVESLQNCGIYYTKETDEGYELTFWSEKTLDIIKKVEEVYSNSKYVKDYLDIMDEPGSDMTGYDDMWQYARSFFARDNALFLTGSANLTSEAALRNMESEYGFLPFPKYDAEQEGYNSNMDTNASIFALPATVRVDMPTASLSRTGTILEYMAFKSHEILLPEYYEEILKAPADEKEDDVRMLNIIRNNVHYEISCLVISDVTGINPIEYTVTNMFTKPSMAKSTYDRNVIKMENALQTFYDGVVALG